MAARWSQREAEIAEMIERYVAAHPQAADTVKGILRWWVGADAPGASRAEVEAACAALAERGILTRVALPDGVILFAAANRTTQAERNRALKPN